jgi:hypothetical protein
LKNVGFPDLAAEQTVQLNLQVKIFAPATAIEFPGPILAWPACSIARTRANRSSISTVVFVIETTLQVAVGGVRARTPRGCRARSATEEGSAGLIPATRLIKLCR